TANAVLRYRVNCLPPQPTQTALVTTLVLIAAAFLGGALNSLAGGGTLVTFPALLFAGLNPIDANASSVVALFSGTFAGAWAYRRTILAVAEFSVLGLFVVSLVGGLIGALLLLWTPTAIFASLVPWLILFATIVFAVGNFAPVDAIKRIQLGPRSALAALFIIAIYGGYFGGGVRFFFFCSFFPFWIRGIQLVKGVQIGAGGCHDNRRDRHVHCGRRGALAGGPTDARRFGGRLLHGRALGAAARSTVDQGLRCRTRSRPDRLFCLAWRLSKVRRHAAAVT